MQHRTRNSWPPASAAFKKHDRHDRRSKRSSDRAQVRFHLEAGKQPEQHHNRQSCNQSRKPPTTKRVIDLSPVHEVPSQPSRQQRRQESFSECEKASENSAVRSSGAVNSRVTWSQICEVRLLCDLAYCGRM